MNKNKSILIPLFITILFFSFNSRVEAENTPKDYCNGKKFSYPSNSMNYKYISDKAFTNDELYDILGTLVNIGKGENPFSAKACVKDGDKYYLYDLINTADSINDGCKIKFVSIKMKYNSDNNSKIGETNICNKYETKGTTIPTICGKKAPPPNLVEESNTCKYPIEIYNKNGKSDKEGGYIKYYKDLKNTNYKVPIFYVYNNDDAVLDSADRSDNEFLGGNNTKYKMKNKSNKTVFDIIDNCYKTESNHCCKKIAVCYDDKKTNLYLEADDTSCSQYTGTAFESTEGEATKTQQNTETESKSYIDHDPFKDFSLLGDLTEEDLKKTLECEDLFENSEDLKNMIKLIINIIRIAVPIILIVFGVIDFGKAVFSSSEDTMKKAQGAFIKRIIIAVCILLVPTILKILLTIANQIWPSISADLCGIL